MKTTSANGPRPARAARAKSAARAAPSTAKARKPLQPLGAARVIAERPARSAGERSAFVALSDGWYWLAEGGQRRFGPFATLADARADRDGEGGERFDDTETLEEAESEIGIADWIDAETGEPAEGQSPPHLEEH